MANLSSPMPAECRKALSILRTVYFTCVSKASPVTWWALLNLPCHSLPNFNLRGLPRDYTGHRGPLAHY